MRKILLICTIPGLIFAAHNFKLNGLKQVTVIQGDILNLTFDFEKAGDTALYKIYIDGNKNGVVDAGEILLTWGKFYDGSFLDEDETKNGSYHQVNKETGEFPNTQLIIRADDNGVTDNAVLVVQSPTSNFSIYGQTTTNGAAFGYPNIIAVAQYTDSATQRCWTYRGISDGSGNYNLNIPESLGNRNWNVVWGNLLGQHSGGYLSALDSIPLFVLINGHVKRDMRLGLHDGPEYFNKVKDDAGSPLPDSILVWGWSKFSKPGSGYDWGGISGGVWVDYTVMSGLWPSFLDIMLWGQGETWHFQPLADPLFPNYLTPPDIKSVYGIGPPPDLICYKADTTVSGHIYKDGGGADGIRVQAEDTVLTGKTWTGSFSDGHYELRVSSKADSYRVWLNPNDIPTGYKVQEDFRWAKPAATFIDFQLISTGVSESDKTAAGLLKISPTIIKDRFQVELFLLKSGPFSLRVYDAFGRLVMIQTNFNFGAGYHTVCFTTDDLVQGVYFIELNHNERKLTEKLIILR